MLDGVRWTIGGPLGGGSDWEGGRVTESDGGEACLHILLPLFPPPLCAGPRIFEITKISRINVWSIKRQ